MRFCLMLEGQEGVTWPDWLGAAHAAERLGFEAIFTSDHYLSVIRHRDRDRGSSDAGRCSRRSPRRPRRSGSARWSPRHVPTARRVGEGRGYGRPRQRRSRRDRHGRGLVGGRAPHTRVPVPGYSHPVRHAGGAARDRHGLLVEERFSFQGKHYQLDAVPFAPKGVQEPHPPIVVGGNGGPRVAALVSRWADEFNTVGPLPEQARERFRQRARSPRRRWARAGLAHDLGDDVVLRG